MLCELSSFPSYSFLKFLLFLPSSSLKTSFSETVGSHLLTLILHLLGATVFFLQSVPRLFILLFWLVLSPLQWRHSTKGLHHLLHTELQTTNTHIRAHLLLGCLPRCHPWVSGGTWSSTCLKLNSTTSFQVCISSQSPNQGQTILDTILSFIFSPKSFINSTGSTECLVCVGAGH